jgi:DNA-binding CsgD family transcriptional regulator
MGQWSKLSDQGERLWKLVEIVPSGVTEAKSRTPKQVHRRLRPTEVGELIASYKNGSTVYELAEQFRIHRETVSALLERQGIPRRGRPLSPAQIEQAAKLYDSGLSLAKVAPQLGCDPGTVRLALLKSGMRMRNNHGSVK